MSAAENIEKMIKKFCETKKSSVTMSDEMDKRILSDALTAYEKSETKKSADSQPNIWRIIMKSRITKLAAAAVVVIAVLIGIHYFGESIDGTSVAWADVVKKVEKIQTFICRTRQTETSGQKKEGFEFVTEKEGISYNSSEYGNREEFYNNGELTTRSYSLRKKKEFIGICPLAKDYERHPLTEVNLKEMDQMNPRQIVSRFMSGKWKELGYDTINGIKVKGIEANDPKVLRDPPPPVQNFIARLWVDVETELPVWVEVQFVPPGSTIQTRIVIDRFQWNADLSAKDFEPNIPADYKLKTTFKPSDVNEAVAIEELREFAKTYASVSGGCYPKNLGVMSIFQEAAAYGKKMKESETSEQHTKLSPERHKMLQKLPLLSKFYTNLEQGNKDVAYYGDKVVSDDVNTVLMRWKISDDEYRVIYGDLTAENVSEEKLAELETALPE